MACTGHKRWTLWPAAKDSPLAQSGESQPPTKFVGITRPGDILYFAPGWWHGTTSIGGSPTLGLSLYLDFPTEKDQPTDFFRERKAALLGSTHYCGCGHAWQLLSAEEHEKQKEHCRFIRAQGSTHGLQAPAVTVLVDAGDRRCGWANVHLQLAVSQCCQQGRPQRTCLFVTVTPCTTTALGAHQCAASRHHNAVTIAARGVNVPHPRHCGTEILDVAWRAARTKAVIGSFEADNRCRRTLGQLKVRFPGNLALLQNATFSVCLHP